MSEEMLEHLYSVAFESDSIQSETIIKYIDELRKENETFKNVIKSLVDNKVEKDNNATEIKLPHVCKYALLLNEYQSWLAKEKTIVYRDCGHTQNAMIKCYDKLKELRKKYERDDIDE